MIETTRLISRPLSLPELGQYIYDLPQFEAQARLAPSGHQHSADLLWMVSTITEPALRAEPGLLPYYTIWVVVGKASRQLVADWGFKGPPSPEGAIEIGYGTHPGQQGQGYMTEVVGGILAWARQQPGIRQVRAETGLANAASQRVLERNQFRVSGAKEGFIYWSFSF
jgi:RimJ/RimL family protein N-acetyltransferase